MCLGRGGLFAKPCLGFYRSRWHRNPSDSSSWPRSAAVVVCFVSLLHAASCCQEVFLNRARLLELWPSRHVALVSEVMTTLTAAKKKELADFFTVRTVRGLGKRSGLCPLSLLSPHFRQLRFFDALCRLRFEGPARWPWCAQTSSGGCQRCFAPRQNLLVNVFCRKEWHVRHAAISQC